MAASLPELKSPLGGSDSPAADSLGNFTLLRHWPSSHRPAHHQTWPVHLLRPLRKISPTFLLPAFLPLSGNRQRGPPKNPALECQGLDCVLSLCKGPKQAGRCIQSGRGLTWLRVPDGLSRPLSVPNATGTEIAGGEWRGSSWLR